MIEASPSAFGVVLLLIGYYVALSVFFQRRDNLSRTLLTVVPLVLGLRYLYWRLTETVLPAEFGGISSAWIWIVYVTEALAYVEVFIFLLIMSRSKDRAGEAQTAQDAMQQAGQYPSVDVFIPTYNEPIEVLEKTIIGAQKMDYPNFTVHVLDDGRRDWLRAFCEEKGVSYITRDDNNHAKAGNMNNALHRTHADLIAVMDADFVTHKNFLRRTAGMFLSDPKLGILQTPQHFYNRDPVQMNLRIGQIWPDEQRLFFDEMAASRDAWNVAFCCGSCSVTRRQAIVEAGGFPTSSITEDLLSTLVLRRRGWSTKYLNERLSMGLAAESLEAFFVQRARWCQGGIQTIFLPDGPLGQGIPLLDRILFFPISWLVQYPVRMMSVIIPIVYLLTGIKPLLYTSMDDVIWYLLPLILSYFVTMRWLAPDKYMPVLSTAIGVFSTFRLLPTVLSSIVRPFGKPFRVTPKGTLTEAGIDWITFVSIMGAILLTIIGLLLNSIESSFVVTSDAFFPIAAGWAFAQLVVLVLASLICFDAPRYRSEERFSFDHGVTLIPETGGAIQAKGVDISLGGVQLEVPQKALHDIHLIAGQIATIHMDGIGQFSGRILAHRSARIILEFDWADSQTKANRDAMIGYLFSGELTNEVTKSENIMGLWVRLVRRYFAST